MNLLYNRRNFTLISKTLCICQAFLCLIVIFHKARHLWDNICGGFNAVSINISCKTYKSTKSPIVLRNHLAKVKKNQMSLSNGIMRLITRISKIFLWPVSCENSLYQKWFCPKESFVFCKVLSLLSLQHVKTAVWNLHSRSLFHFVQTRTEKFLQLTLVMKCRFFATSRVLFRIGVMTFLSYCN